MYHARYFSPDRTLIIAHYNAAGVISAGLLAAYLNVPLENVIAKYPETGPTKFPEFVQTIDFGKYTHIYILGIPMDVSNPIAWRRAMFHIFNSFKQANPKTRLYLTYADYHPSSVPILRYLPMFTRILFFPGAYHLAQFVAPDDENAKFLTLVAGAVERDREVARILRGMPSRERKRVLEAADAYDYLVRRDIRQALACAYVFEVPREKPQFSIPEHIVDGPIVVATEELERGWGPKILEKLADRYDVPYALGYSYDPVNNRYVVRAITYWLSEARPVALLLRSEPNAGTPEAPIFFAKSRGEAMTLMLSLKDEIINALKSELARKPSTMASLAEEI